MDTKELKIERTISIEVCESGIYFVDGVMCITSLSAVDMVKDCLGVSEVKKVRKPRKGKKGGEAAGVAGLTPAPRAGRPKKITIVGTDGEKK